MIERRISDGGDTVRELVYKLIYVFLSGLTEFLPVSSRPHQMLLEMLAGREMADPFVELSIHLGCLLALLFICKDRIRRLLRENRHEKISRRHKNRNVDRVAILDIRVLKTASVALLVGMFFLQKGERWVSSLWLISVTLVLNGFLLFLPRITAQGNKDSRHLGGLHALILGLGGALGVIPGFSRVGSTLTAGHISGADRDYVLNMAFLLCVPALIFLIVLDIIAVISGGAALSLLWLLAYLLMTALAFGTAYVGIFFMRYLSSRFGFALFSYYSWGMALFFFIFYLMV